MFSDFSSLENGLTKFRDRQTTCFNRSDRDYSKRLVLVCSQITGIKGALLCCC